MLTLHCSNLKRKEIVSLELRQLASRASVAHHHILILFKGTGTRDLIWLKVVSLERS